MKQNLTANKDFLKTKVVSTTTFKKQSCQLLRNWVSDALAGEGSSRISLGVLTQSRLTNFFIISFWFFRVCFSQWFGTVHTHHSPTLRLASGHICFFYYSTGMGWFTPGAQQSQEKWEDNIPSSSCCRRDVSSMSRNKYLSDGLSSHMVLILAVTWNSLDEVMVAESQTLCIF